MTSARIKWNSLLNLTDIEIVPEPLKTLNISDELIQALSWLTAATNHDRKLVRCTEQGAILIGNAWDLLQSVETDELYAESDSPDTFTATVANKGVLISVGAYLVKVTVVRKSGGDEESFYLPADSMYFFPNTVYTVTVTCVPPTGGDATYVGITAYN